MWHILKMDFIKNLCGICWHIWHICGIFWSPMLKCKVYQFENLQSCLAHTLSSKLASLCKVIAWPSYCYHAVEVQVPFVAVACWISSTVGGALRCAQAQATHSETKCIFVNFFQKNNFQKKFPKFFVPDGKIFGNKNAIKRDFLPVQGYFQIGIFVAYLKPHFGIYFPRKPGNPVFHNISCLWLLET